MNESDIIMNIDLTMKRYLKQAGGILLSKIFIHLVTLVSVTLEEEEDDDDDFSCVVKPFCLTDATCLRFTNNERAAGKWPVNVCVYRAWRHSESELGFSPTAYGRNLVTQEEKHKKTNLHKSREQVSYVPACISLDIGFEITFMHWRSVTKETQKG